MQAKTIEADYLIVGAGATGMAFADSLVSESDATMVIVDRYDRPGGHWNNAYPYVRLHQPALMYGVNSRPLGTGAKYEIGLNKGFYELASGSEVLSHFDLVMQQQLLPSGRVHFLPMSEVAEDRTVRSLLSGEITAVMTTKIVDATYSKMQIPATHPPEYDVDAGVTCVPPNELPRRAGAYRSFVVIGAGKTGIDACIWLLENGADPDSIRWVMPRDPWLLNRANVQPGDEFLERTTQTLADEIEALALSSTIDEVFERLEATGELLRIDPSVTPSLYHCAVVSEGELHELRRISDVIRLGRVVRIDGDQIVLEHGTIPTSDASLYIDCSASGIPRKPTRPVFEGNEITLQWVRLCQPTFSAALIGFVEASFEDEGKKNELCAPIAPPNIPLDWMRMMAVDLANRHHWSRTPEIAEWQSRSRLDGFTHRLRSLSGTETGVIANLERYRANIKLSLSNLVHLLEDQPLEPSMEGARAPA